MSTTIKYGLFRNMGEVIAKLSLYVSTIFDAVDGGFYSSHSCETGENEHLSPGGFYTDRFNMRDDVRRVGDDMKKAMKESKEKVNG